MREGDDPGRTGQLGRDQLALRSGVDLMRIDALIASGVLQDKPDGYTVGDVRRVIILQGVLDAGLPLDAVANGVKRGVLPIDFTDSDVFRRFAGLVDESFEAVSDRTGIPLDWLAVLREVTGWGHFEPDGRIREDELEVVPWLAAQARLGFRRPAVERFLRSMGDTLRRLAEAQAGWFRTEIQERYIAEGRVPEIARVDPENRLSELGEQALLALFRAQEAQTWIGNVVIGFEQTMATAGLHEPVVRHPSICFLDITGYTRLTQERGDAAAAQLAETLGTLVNRRSGEHGGRPVKWLGDGVMFHFREAAGAVAAALQMVHGVLEAGLPPAHVGIHTGPVIVQSGDYYGQTVNLAARIAEYARAGEVLVSEQVRATSEDGDIRFVDIGVV
ncbi:MAG TPA: adenylate/guanylate cyclase domain-containing protein, partial [Candidatus Limnocylindrales bacterium]|nr:adenylate/guanylate cyclase domain-containing protein [Candidatus Limnocylindrales bacterium]